MPRPPGAARPPRGRRLVRSPPPPFYYAGQYISQRSSALGYRRTCRGTAPRLAAGATWFAGGKKSFVTLWADGHHGNHFPHLWCAGLPGAQEALTGSAPEAFFRPPYVGHRGWIGVRLDGAVDWAEVGELCADAYRAVAPPRLVALLDAG